jgi:hypothetical protein
VPSAAWHAGVLADFMSPFLPLKRGSRIAGFGRLPPSGNAQYHNEFICIRLSIG